MQIINFKLNIYQIKLGNVIYMPFSNRIHGIGFICLSQKETYLLSSTIVINFCVELIRYK